MSYVRVPDASGRLVHVPLPPEVRTRRQRELFRAKLLYHTLVRLLALHSNKVVIAMLQRAYPDTPWKNLVYAARHT